MSLKEINNKIKKIKADEETKDAFLELIDHKIEKDMEKALTQMDKSVNRIEASIDKLKTKLESSIGSLKDGILSNRSENKFTQWLVIALFTVVSIAIAVGVFNFKNK